MLTESEAVAEIASYLNYAEFNLTIQIALNSENTEDKNASVCGYLADNNQSVCIRFASTDTHYDQSPIVSVGSREVAYFLDIPEASREQIDSNMSELAYKEFKPVFLTQASIDFAAHDQNNAYTVQSQVCVLDEFPASLQMQADINGSANDRLTMSNDGTGCFTLADIRSYSLGEYNVSNLLVTDIQGYETGYAGIIGTFSIYDSNQAPKADAGPDENMSIGETKKITALATDDGNVTYEWREGSSILSTQATFYYSPTTLGEHNLTLTVTDDRALSDSDTKSIMVFSAPTISMEDQTIDDNGGFISTELPAPTVTNLESGAVYSFVNNSPCTYECDYITIDSATGVITWDGDINPSKSYDINLTVTNPDGGKASTTFTLYVTDNL